MFVLPRKECYEQEQTRNRKDLAKAHFANEPKLQSVYILEPLLQPWLCKREPGT